MLNENRTPLDSFEMIPLESRAVLPEPQWLLPSQLEPWRLRLVADLSTAIRPPRMPMFTGCIDARPVAADVLVDVAPDCHPQLPGPKARRDTATR